MKFYNLAALSLLSDSALATYQSNESSDIYGFLPQRCPLVRMQNVYASCAYTDIRKPACEQVKIHLIKDCLEWDHPAFDAYIDQCLSELDTLFNPDHGCKTAEALRDAFTILYGITTNNQQLSLVCKTEESKRCIKSFLHFDRYCVHTGGQGSQDPEKDRKDVHDRVENACSDFPLDSNSDFRYCNTTDNDECRVACDTLEEICSHRDQVCNEGADTLCGELNQDCQTEIHNYADCNNIMTEENDHESTVEPEDQKPIVETNRKLALATIISWSIFALSCFCLPVKALFDHWANMQRVHPV